MLFNVTCKSNYIIAKLKTCFPKGIKEIYANPTSQNSYMKGYHLHKSITALNCNNYINKPGIDTRMSNIAFLEITLALLLARLNLWK